MSTLRSNAPSPRLSGLAETTALGMRRSANWWQLSKFCVVGASGYLINLAVFSLLVAVAGVPYLVAAILSFLVAVTNNYAWNRRWTFRRERGHLVFQGLRFLTVSTIALAANLSLLALYIHLGLPEVAAQAVAILSVTPFSFLANKLWSFGS
ncbi:MAG: GtrA family protein [Gaiellaceae bacterium]